MQQLQQLRTCHFLSILKHSHSKKTDLRPIPCHQPAFLEEETRNLAVPTVKHGCRSTWELYPYLWDRPVLIFPTWKNVSRRMTRKQHLHSKAKCEIRPWGQERTLLLQRELGLFKLEERRLCCLPKQTFPPQVSRQVLWQGKHPSLCSKALEQSGPFGTLMSRILHCWEIRHSSALFLQELFHPVQDDSAMDMYSHHKVVISRAELSINFCHIHFATLLLSSSSSSLPYQPLQFRLE